MMQVLIRLLKLLGGFAVIWILLIVYNNFGCQAVEGGEMEPTLKRDSRKTVDPRIRSVEQLQREDLVSFTYEMPGKSQKTYAARVIGLPGDRVEIVKGEVIVNNQKLGSNYVAATNRNDPKENFAEIVVPRDSVYLLCDSRRSFEKSDSRVLGPIGIWALNGKFR
jgi:signal peptidase I